MTRKSRSVEPTITLLQEVGDVTDDNVDAVVRIPGEVGRRSATFFTFKNIASLISKYRSSGECLSGDYFWARDMVLVKDLRPETLESIVREMIRTGEYMTAFGEMTED